MMLSAVITCENPSCMKSITVEGFTMGELRQALREEGWRALGRNDEYECERCSA